MLIFCFWVFPLIETRSSLSSSSSTSKQRSSWLFHSTLSPALPRHSPVSPSVSSPRWISTVYNFTYFPHAVTHQFYLFVYSQLTYMYIPNSDLIPSLDILSSLLHSLTGLENYISADSIFCLQSLQTRSVNKIILLDCSGNTCCRNYNIR